MVNRNKNNLLEGNLYRNIIRLGLPLALASVLHTFYNLADTFWLGRLGRQTLSAPIISFNIIFFIISLAIDFQLQAHPWFHNTLEPEILIGPINQPETY